MKAVVLNTPAPIEEGPLEVVDRETPSPGAGQILMRVAAHVLPDELEFARRLRSSAPGSRPTVPC
jgi:NADPH:quinone reductase-like Zn-dependent oxidoreductase